VLVDVDVVVFGALSSPPEVAAGPPLVLCLFFI